MGGRRDQQAELTGRRPGLKSYSMSAPMLSNPVLIACRTYLWSGEQLDVKRFES